MAARTTESMHAEATGLDARPPNDILKILLQAQIEAAMAVRHALPAIVQAAELAAASLSSGGRLIYAGAGSSGLMAMADALELPGTFGIPHDRIAILFAGGMDGLTEFTGGPEDDSGLARREVVTLSPIPKDCVIATTASGSTPYAVAALEAARLAGARTIGIANNEAAPLFDYADVPVLLPTPPEVVAGSTRMGAGTAQKIALNLLSTLMAIQLGHVHDGYMVNLRADNLKLRDRAVRIVAAIAGCSTEDAGIWLDKADGSIKSAVLLAAGASDKAAAENMLDNAGQYLRAALSKIKGNTDSVYPALEAPQTGRKK
ncbi:N-acetylmuramic acid 6-phosphate etherase [Mesorhizobium sp. J18]|uniref:N-acetylmuramic acid 6-phosphate etherase n=1 Tax=Mesorhizobium sp. J18 TaxID=935263 RepID=UPI001198E591|nr:N-acetylmuramic acid 6-phosphate etherase [Mesorhizobium sp. J18]TWH00121.1 N-acetylmuramic acid 6-phosphate etherase [Mesorhizobium sp. J18]